MSDGRIVLITGCSTGGIGYALQVTQSRIPIFFFGLTSTHSCQQFSEEGCKVYATSRKLETIQDFGSPRIERLSLDVTSDDDVRRVIHHVVEVEGRIDIVVNNAGAMCAGNADLWEGSFNCSLFFSQVH